MAVCIFHICSYIWSYSIFSLYLHAFQRLTCGRFGSLRMWLLREELWEVGLAGDLCLWGGSFVKSTCSGPFLSLSLGPGCQETNSPAILPFSQQHQDTVVRWPWVVTSDARSPKKSFFLEMVFVREKKAWLRHIIQFPQGQEEMITHG